MMGIYATRAQRRQMAAENARQPRTLREIPCAEWPASETNRLRVLRSRDFLVQEYPAAAPAVVRLSICRTTLSGGEWVDGITWDDLQRLKRECGYGDADAIEIYPGDLDVVNVANMRHLWIMAAPVACAWRRTAQKIQAAEAGVKKMEMREIISELFDNAIRVESVIHLGAMCMDDAWPSVASDAFEFDAKEIWEAIGVEDPEVDDTSEWSESIRDAGKLGFLIQFATPVPEHFYEGGHSISWGYYTTKWIYDESFESACARALKWQDEFVEKCRVKEMEDQKQPSKGRG